MISRFETFQRMLGIKGGQFRRTGVTGGNIVVGVVLGVLSGKYIFEEPMQRYWAEKHAADAAAAGAISSSSNDGKEK
ncbi:hypothetical protein ACHAWT_008726 [Skeletonema menzelii]